MLIEQAFFYLPEILVGGITCGAKQVDVLADRTAKEKAKGNFEASANTSVCI